MNLYTLGDAITAVSRFVEDGSGACDRDTVVDRVNEACERLMVKGDWKHSLVVVRARVNNQEFPLPREIESVRAINIDNGPSTVNSPYFRFMASGPGEERSWSGTGHKDFDELGIFPVMFDIPSIDRPDGSCSETGRTFASNGLQIMAFSTSPSDANLKVSLRGVDKYNTELGATEETFVPAEELQINSWHGVEGTLTTPLSDLHSSERLYRQLTGWSKPQTAGYITLYAVELSTSRMWFLAKAHPNDTRPAWRRFRLRGQTNCGSNILILGKLGAVRMTDNEDILSIQSIPAVKHMVQCLEFENKQQLKNAMEYEATAIRLLSEQKQDYDSNGPEVQVIDHDVELMGASTNRWYSR